MTTLTDALKLILTRSPNASTHALDCLRAAQINSPMVNRRYAYVLEIAFNDPDAQFSPQERADLVSVLEIDGQERKSEMIALRLTPAEYAYVRSQAGEMSVSDYIRSKIL